MNRICVKKTLAVIVILLFISVSVIPSTGDFAREKHDSTENLLLSPPMVSNTVSPNVTIILNGTMGENGWYVSCVEINITTDDNVSTVYYSIDNGSWQTFGGVIIVVCDDGLHIFCWYYVDNEGNESAIECIEFKIDQTPPIIDLTLETDKEYGIWYITFTATCSDATSGMDRVEFYMDDELVCTDDEAPYEWIYTVPFVSHVIGLIFNPQFSEENVTFFALIVIITNEHNSSSVYSKYFYAIAYDKAGNSETDDISGISYIPPGIYMFQHLTFPNNYTGYMGRFFIRATFEE